MSRNSPKQYDQHGANREWRCVATALLLNLGDRSTPKWRLDEQVAELERLLPMCGKSLDTDIKRYRIEALKAQVAQRGQKPAPLRVIKGGKS